MAIADACESKAISRALGEPLTDANLFHLAPLVCLKFRGRKLKGREAERVTKVALANYVVNSGPEGIDHGLEQRPLMAFTLCYVAAHLALDLLDEQQAEAILIYCEDRLEEALRRKPRIVLDGFQALVHGERIVQPNPFVVVTHEAEDELAATDVFHPCKLRLERGREDIRPRTGVGGDEVEVIPVPL